MIHANLFDTYIATPDPERQRGQPDLRGDYLPPDLEGGSRDPLSALPR
jgi:hypothetical protein